MMSLEKFLMQRGENDKASGLDALAGWLEMGGGIDAAKRIKPLVTGRETLYHGTTHTNADEILQDGLKPSAKPGITLGIDDAVADEAKKYAYMAKSKAAARGYAGQAEGLEKYMQARRSGLFAGKSTDQDLVKEYWTSPERALDGTGLGPNKGRVLKASVPMWDMETARNPEIGNHNLVTWQKESVRRSLDKLKGAGTKITAAHKVGANIGAPLGYAAMSKDVAFPKGVPAEHFVESPSFKKLGLSELGHYIKKHPGRFAGGLGAAVAAPYLIADGVGALGDWLMDK